MDIKPTNVLISDEAREPQKFFYPDVKVADFGLGFPIPNLYYNLQDSLAARNKGL